MMVWRNYIFLVSSFTASAHASGQPFEGASLFEFTPSGDPLLIVRHITYG